MNKLVKSVVAFGLATMMLAPMMAVAAENTVPGNFRGMMNNLNDVGGGAGLNTTRTLPQMIGAIINAALGLLGIVMVGIIIFAGYKWMMAQGNSDEVGKAKTMILQAVVGMIILMASYAIATFVLNAITTGTGVVTT